MGAAQERFTLFQVKLDGLVKSPTSMSAISNKVAPLALSGRIRL
jgi:hypothetical protein